MAKKKYPYEYTDAKGNTVIHYKDGTCEMYVGGKDSAEEWQDVSNDADRMVGRTRYLPKEPMRFVPPIATRHTQDEDEGVPGIDDLEDA